MVLGRHSESFIASAFIAPGHSLSYEHVVFAETENQIIGMYSTFTETQQRTFSEEPLQRAAKKHALRLNIARIVFAPFWRILETIPEGDCYVQGIAIEPKHRGAGIGSLLMRDIEARAKAKGASRLSLDVSAKNEGAKRLYKRLGMEECSNWPNTRLLPTVLVRMAKKL